MTAIDDTTTTGDAGSAWRRYILEQILEQLDELCAARQLEHGGEHHRDGTGPRVPMAFGIARMADHADDARNACARASANDDLTWMHLLRRDVFAALAETEWPALRAKLLTVAAGCVAWIEDGDSRD